MFINKSAEKSREIMQNLMESKGTTDFSFLQKYSAKWFPALTKTIFKELRNTYEIDYQDSRYTSNLKTFMSMLPPEKLSLLTIQVILKAIVARIVNLQKNDDSSLLYEEDHTLEMIPIRQLIDDVGKNILREIFFNAKMKRFEKLLEEEKDSLVFKNPLYEELNETQKNIKWKYKQKFKINSYRKKLIDFMILNNSKDFNHDERIMPETVKLQISSHLLYIGKIYNFLIIIT